MRISDWSSDVCSSDLFVWPLRISDQSAAKRNHVELFTFDAFSDFLDIVGNDCAACFKRSKQVFRQADATDRHQRLASQLFRPRRPRQVRKIGRASCRERVCQYVSNSVVAVSLKKKKSKKQYT